MLWERSQIFAWRTMRPWLNRAAGGRQIAKLPEFPLLRAYPILEVSELQSLVWLHRSVRAVEVDPIEVPELFR
jgi:hypothetical protein